MASRHSRDSRVTRLENALKDMHRSLEDPDAADEERILSHVRRRAARAARPAARPLAASIELREARRLFSRFAAGAALAAVLAAVYAMTTGYGPEMELARLYALDPAGMLLMPLLGV